MLLIEEHISLAPFTTFGIGGIARHFARVQTLDALQKAITFAKEKKLSVLMLGGGSNMLVADQGFEGLVLKLELMGIERQLDTLVAGAGESWDELVARAVSEELWGLENLSGIPGTVGGAVVQSIGAYGAAVSKTVLWVEAFDRETGNIKRMNKEECAFGYRDSFFKQDGGRHVVLRAAFGLSSVPLPNLSYRDLAARFSGEAALLDIRKAILAIRKDKFPDLSIEGTAGSFFKNPILSEAEARRLQEQYPEMPLFAMPETAGIKVPLAWLLDKVLGVKGMQEGGARLFERQPLVIAAAGNTSARDVITLAQKVKTLVKEKLNLDIEEEVKIII